MKSLSSVVSANRVVASGLMEGSMVVSAAWLRDARWWKVMQPVW